MPKEKSPPVNLDKYLEGRNHKYMTYEKASRLYGLPYWGFVSVAKEAKATWKLRKTAIVDIVVFEKYLEEHCAISEDEDVMNILASRNRDSGAVETYIPDTEIAFDWLNYHS